MAETGIFGKIKNFFTGGPDPNRDGRKADLTNPSGRDRRQGAYRGTSKYGPIRYNTEHINEDPATRRMIAREVYNESLIARGIVKRFVNNVINTGLTWESTPMWELINDGPETEEDRYALTRYLENRWTLYTKSKESDIRKELTFPQLERLLFRTYLIEGEFWVILRYLNAVDRMSPVAMQIVQNDQVATPYDSMVSKNVETRGGKIQDGVEFDATGKAVAIWVREKLWDDPKRIPFYGPRSGRQFVIHCANIENPGQVRGLPELSALVYELSRLTEYDIAELEAVVAGALWMGVTYADVNARPGKHPTLKPNTPNQDTNIYAPKTGIETVEIGGRALIMNNLEPGYKFEGFQPNRPNPNYNAFVEAFETRLCGALGMPISVFKQKFQASYSAARAEILFFWNEVITRRSDFIDGFLSDFHRIVFTEWEKSGEVKLPGFNIPLIRHAWLNGYWTGISRPVVDPVKEVKAVESRLNLGHTTGEREAKAYNGSDYRENVERLKTENALRAEANQSLTPAESEEVETDDKGDREDDK